MTIRPRHMPKRGQQRLQDAQLPDDVDVELPRELVRRQELERPGDRDPGVRDEPVELLDLPGALLRSPLRP